MAEVLTERNAVRVFEKDLEVINAMREAAFRPPAKAVVAQNATASHRPPSSDCHALTEFESSGFEFREMFSYWFAFKGDLAAPAAFDPSVHFLHIDFVIKRNHMVIPDGRSRRSWRLKSTISQGGADQATRPCVLGFRQSTKTPRLCPTGFAF
jgi:hypothetical protein